MDNPRKSRLNRIILQTLKYKNALLEASSPDTGTGFH